MTKNVRGIWKRSNKFNSSLIKASEGVATHTLTCNNFLMNLKQTIRGVKYGKETHYRIDYVQAGR